ncbi:MAG TPA: hypothetical protein VJ853_13120, partial [Thermoanaerobaculia bacterium]|nr:hypothetical protein [Thermoanaerobaculia bacterium]
MENRRVEEVQRLVSERVAVPIDDPRIEQRIAEIGDRGAEADGERPGEEDGQQQIEREDPRFAPDSYSQRASQSATSLYQTRLFSGLEIQWFSSGHTSSRL